MRWVGHRLYADVYIAVDPHLTVAEGHEIGEQLRHTLFHEIGNLSEVLVHVDPWAEDREAYHQTTLHHEPIPRQVID
jgi:divalent metal cation (Fe/Co/Zn/Cd) transporter